MVSRVDLFFFKADAAGVLPVFVRKQSILRGAAEGEDDVQSNKTVKTERIPNASGEAGRTIAAKALIQFPWP
jgi:hypothetical protein